MMVAGLPLGDLFAVVALLLLFVAAYEDVRRFEIPDILSIALLVGAACHGLVTPGFGWLSHIAAPVVMFGIGLFIFSRGWMGGGDVKLLVGVAGWTGLAGLPMQLAGVAMAGGVLALVLLFSRGVLASASGGDTARLPKVFRKDAPLPYAVAIAAGTCWWAAIAWPVS
jgi:prepilin peptidase CpaA